MTAEPPAGPTPQDPDASEQTQAPVGASPAYSPGPGVYPQQELTAQQVKPGRNRVPLFIGLGLVLLLIAGGTTAWYLLRNDGESRRGDYCTALKQITKNGNLEQALAAADSDTAGQVSALADLAPSSVASDWGTLQKLVDQGAQAQPDVATALAALGAVRSIVDDANSECGMSLQLPLP